MWSVRVLSTSVWVFSRDPDVLSHPRDVHVRWIGAPTLSLLSECGGVYERGLWWKGVLSRVGSRLAPRAAGIGSGPLQPSTRISGLENSYLVFIHRS